MYYYPLGLAHELTAMWNVDSTAIVQLRYCTNYCTVMTFAVMQTPIIIIYAQYCGPVHLYLMDPVVLYFEKVCSFVALFLSGEGSRCYLGTYKTK